MLGELERMMAAESEARAQSEIWLYASVCICVDHFAVLSKVSFNERTFVTTLSPYFTGGMCMWTKVSQRANAAAHARHLRLMRRRP